MLTGKQVNDRNINTNVNLGLYLVDLRPVPFLDGFSFSNHLHVSWSPGLQLFQDSPCNTRMKDENSFWALRFHVGNVKSDAPCSLYERSISVLALKVPL